jgi:hypothetical protein
MNSESIADSDEGMIHLARREKTGKKRDKKRQKTTTKNGQKTGQAEI